jgi:1-acyl-sn-glycerol-3-phosphate acyltransferase
MIRPARYHFYRWLARSLWSLMGGVDVRGLENIPKSGAFIMIANHQSFLDPILVQAVCPRILHSMAKSTQFASPIFRRLLAQLYSFPVRRFEVDPQAVRQVLRRLKQGNAVIVYIEGERSWDGRLQSPRLGTVRVALKAGVPIVPVRVDGAYEAWPRWHRKIRRNRIRIEFREPFRLPHLESREEREPHVLDAADQIMNAIRPAVRSGR